MSHSILPGNKNVYFIVSHKLKRHF